MLHGAFEVVELAGFRRRHDQRPGFGADDVIGRDQSGAGVARHVFAVHVVQDHVVAAEIQDQPLVRALAEGIAQRAGAADDRRHVRNSCDLVRQLSRQANFALPFFRRRSSASVTNSIMRS